MISSEVEVIPRLNDGHVDSTQKIYYCCNTNILDLPSHPWGSKVITVYKSPLQTNFSSGEYIYV